MKLLHKKVNHYWLLCQGLGITPPPNMVSKCVDFAMSSFAGRLLDQLQEAVWSDQVKDSREIEYIKKKLLNYKHRATGMKINHTVASDMAFIYLDLDNWTTSLGNVDDIYYNLIKYKLNGIRCEVNYTGILGTNLAAWVPSQLRLIIGINFPKSNNLEDFKKILDKMERFESSVRISITHELIHFTQQVGNLIKQTPWTFGLPPKKVRDTDVDPLGRIKKKEPGGEHKSVPHAFIDVEFYTNLNDAIETYKHFVKNIDSKLKPLFFKIFTAQATNAEVNDFLSHNKTLPKTLISKNIGIGGKINRRFGFWWFLDLKPGEPRWNFAIKKFFEAVS